MHFSFSKYTGCGNDFILVDDRARFFPFENQHWIADLCHRQLGIGADGLILLQNSTSADYRMRIFNADGKEAEMCGNGMRCLFKFIRSLGEARVSLWIETMERRLKLSAKEDNVTVGMGDPVDIRWNLQLPNPVYSQPIHYLNTGVPHAVLFYESIEQLEMRQLGQALRHHQAFAPGGANINAAMITETGDIHVRTFERGVEGETLACGTGMTAVALAAAKTFGCRGPIRVVPRTKEILEIDFIYADGQFKNVTMTGPATFVFRGELIR